MPEQEKSWDKKKYYKSKEKKDFQRFEAMLRSIHQGQIILLQSLQLVAPPDSIPTVEQFNEWVAWPGTQPPLHREDEDPAAQVPHQSKDESSKSSTPEPLIRKRRVVVTQEAAATSEKSLEATLELPTPMMMAKMDELEKVHKEDYGEFKACFETILERLGVMRASYVDDL
ncbi:hypothetical protein JHK86_050317 [Glycine max]|nr:hypothetical protein JHK86_050317 [Glycine max]